MTDQPTRLFVFGVNERVSAQEIKEKFEEAGEVTDVENTMNGYAFVTFASRAEAENCIKIHNGRIGFGRPLQIKFAHVPSDASQARTPWYGECVKLKRCKKFNNGGCDQEAFFCEWGIHSCLWCWNKEKINRHHGNTGNCPLKTQHFKDFGRLEPPPPPIEQPNGGRETREFNVTGPAGEIIVFVEDVPPEPAVSLVGHGSTEGALGGESSQGNSRPGQPRPQPSPLQPSPHQPSPHQPSPLQPSPHQPSPHQPSPLQPSPGTSEIQNRAGRRGVQSGLQSSSSAVSSNTRQPSSLQQQQQQLQHQQQQQQQQQQLLLQQKQQQELQKARVQAQLLQRLQHREQQRKGKDSSLQRCESADLSTTSSTVVPSTPSSTRNNSLSLNQISEDRTGRIQPTNPKPKLSRHVQEGALVSGSSKLAAVDGDITNRRNFDDSVELQYSRFKMWISQHVEQLKEELIQLLFPLFTNLYIQLLVRYPGRSAQSPARRFLKAHHAIFLTNPEFKRFIQQLYEANVAEDLENNAVVVAFRAAKYTVTLTEQTYKHLMNYLEKTDSGLLLQTLNQHVEVQIRDPLGSGARQSRGQEGVQLSQNQREARLDQPPHHLQSTRPGQSSVHGAGLGESSQIGSLERIRSASSTGNSSSRRPLNEWERVNNEWKMDQAPYVERVKKYNGGRKPYSKETFQDPIKMGLTDVVISSPAYRRQFSHNSEPSATFQPTRNFLQEDWLFEPTQAGDFFNQDAPFTSQPQFNSHAQQFLAQPPQFLNQTQQQYPPRPNSGASNLGTNNPFLGRQPAQARGFPAQGGFPQQQEVGQMGELNLENPTSSKIGNLSHIFD